MGMFGEAHPAEVRILTLQYKFLVRSSGKNESFALHWARKASYSRPHKESVFYSRVTNQFWMEREQTLNRSLLTGERSEAPSIYDMQDKALQAPLGKLSSCFVFREQPRGQRRKIMCFWKTLDRVDQRVLMNWILNRSAGPWKICGNCQAAPGSKIHLEQCYLGWSHGDSGAPSKIEQLYHACRDQVSFFGLVGLVRRMVGDYPPRRPP
jgi:hypothetical protein